jgi:tetratricopeptide (TPR) repeat protein
MTSHYKHTPSNSNLVDLSGLVQSITSQGRNGMMTVQQGQETRFLRFTAGQLQGMSGGPALAFAKALVWSQVLAPDQLAECLDSLDRSYRPEQLAQAVLDRGFATNDGLLDALDCYIEEGFSEILAWESPALAFSAEAVEDAWAEFQQGLGVSVNPSSLLLEGLRRQDEHKAIEPYLPHPWDVLIQDNAQPVPNDLSPDAAGLLAVWTDGIAASNLFDHTQMPPFRVKTAIAHLRQIGVVRSGTAAEVVVWADDAHSHQRHRDAYGLYARALELGADSPRIHLHLAELAEHFGENEAAAAAYLATAAQMASSDTGGAVVALRNALRLGSDHETPLNQLLAIYLQNNETEEAIKVLMELAEFYEERLDFDQAAKVVRQAQELGADAVNAAMILARLASNQGDQELAALQLELAAHAAQYLGRKEEALTAWLQLIGLAPGRCEHARECAELLAEMDRNAEAIDVLHSTLETQDGANEDALVATYELLARLSPVDTKAHDWLAQAYERRRDRDGATMQLKLIAESQAKAGDYEALISTLERILEVGGDQVDVLTKLAKVRTRLGQDTQAGEIWCRAVDAALALGQIKEARALIARALETNPACLQLRVRQAQVANRDGDAATALAAYRAGADLARGSGQRELARDLLGRIGRMRLDDVLVRVEMAELSEQLKDPQLDRYLLEVVQCAARTNNHGLALDSGRRRVALAGTPGFAQRRELVDLLHRIGDQAGELAEGRALLDLLLEHAEFEKAIDLLLRLVASNNSNPDLVLQLAEVYSAIGDGRQAQRFYRYAISLLQMENRLPEARLALDQLALLAKEDPTIAIVRDLLEKGQPIDWEALRHSQSEDQRRRIVNEIGSGRVEREKKEGKKTDKKADKSYEPSPVAKVETKTMAKEATKAIVKAESKAMAKVEAKAVVRAEVKAVAKAGAKTVPKTEGNDEKKKGDTTAVERAI